MKKAVFAALIAAIVLLGCSKPDQAQTEDAASEGAAQGQATAQDAMEPFFATELTRPRCPAHVNASRYPAPDIVGVRLGMARDEALAVVYCERRTFEVFAENWNLIPPTGQQLGPQAFRLENGTRRECTRQDLMSGGGEYDRVLGRGCASGAPTTVEGATQRIFIASPGEPGHEVVAGIWRREQFETPPTMDSVVNALVTKFGAPSARSQNADGTHLSWVWNPAGTLLPGSDAIVNPCASRIDATTLGVAQVHPDCGLTINANIFASEQNPALAAEYFVAMINQHSTYQQGQRMQQALDQARRAQQQSEVQRAGSAPAPDL